MLLFENHFIVSKLPAKIINAVSPILSSMNQRSDLLENLASEAAKENLCVTVRTLDVTKKVTKFTKCEETV